MNDPRQDPRQAVVDRVLAFWPETVVAARAHGLDPALLAGLVCQESGGRPEAKRHEPGYRWDYGDDPHEHPRLPPGLDLAQDLELQKWSYGLCQVMGAVAREHGFAGHLEELLDPATNLDLGARHLAAKLHQAKGDTRQGLLFYNGGGDKAYPDKVLAWAQAFAPSQAAIAAPVPTPQTMAEAAPKEDAAPVPFPKEEAMNWLLMGPLLNLAIKLACKMIPGILDRVHPGLAETLKSEVSPDMKSLIQKGLEVAQNFVESTPTNLDNYLVQAAHGVVESMGLLPDGSEMPQTATP